VTFISIQELPVAQALEVGKNRESESFEEEDIRCRETGEYRSFVDCSKSSDTPVRLTVHDILELDETEMSSRTVEVMR